MTVHFVGAGPGAADLLTLRAAAALREADVCLYAGTYLDDGVLEHCRSDARLVDTQHLDLDGIIAEIVAAHGAGLEVVRLCSGDPSLYSALAEQTRRLDAADRRRTDRARTAVGRRPTGSDESAGGRRTGRD